MFSTTSGLDQWVARPRAVKEVCINVLKSRPCSRQSVNSSHHTCLCSMTLSSDTGSLAARGDCSDMSSVRSKTARSIKLQTAMVHLSKRRDDACGRLEWGVTINISPERARGSRYPIYMSPPHVVSTFLPLI